MRPFTLLAVGLAVGLLATGCGRENDVGSSSRGSGSDTELTTVENAYLVPRTEAGACAVPVADSGEIRFAVTNNRPVETEALLVINTDVADSVHIAPPPPLDIAPQTRIAAGQPIEQPADPAAPDIPFRVTVDGLDEGLEAGLSVDITFDFEEQGQLTLQIPVEPCPRQMPAG